MEKLCNDMENIGNTIKSWREKRGFTQMQLCEMAGISHKTLVNWEKDKRTPTSFNLNKIANALGLSYEELLQDPEKYKEKKEIESAPAQQQYALYVFPLSKFKKGVQYLDSIGVMNPRRPLDHKSHFMLYVDLFDQPFDHGSLLYVSAAIKPTDDDYVLVEREGKPRITRYGDTDERDSWKGVILE